MLNEKSTSPTPRIFQCDMCPRIFKSRKGLRIHKSHTRRRGGVCALPRGEGLRSIRQPPWVCKFGCGREFDSLDGAAAHEFWSVRRGGCKGAEE